MDTCFGTLPSRNEIDELISWAQRQANALCHRVGDALHRDDLASAGMAGLAEALQRFDPTRGVDFVWFARRRMRGAIRDELRRIDPLSRRDRRWWREQSDPSAPEEVVTPRGDEALRRASAVAQRLTRAQARAGILEQAADESALDPERACIRRDLEAHLRRALERLGARDQIVLLALYWEGSTTVALARRLGVTQGRVSQLRKEAVGRLRGQLQAARVAA